jgi:hypothetical protein
MCDRPDWIMMLDWVGPLLLCREEVERVPDDVAGVYLLHSFAPDFGGYPIFYAGQTSDIRRRLLEHLGRSTTKRDIVALRRRAQPYFSAAPIASTTLRFAVETGLIAALRPVANTQQPSARPVLPNLPPMFLAPTYWSDE